VNQEPLFKVYKLSNNSEIIGEIISERKEYLVMKNPIQIVQIRTMTGNIYPYFQPFTTQSMREELRQVQIAKQHIVASYNPSPIITQEYHDELRRLETSRTMPIEDFEEEVEEAEAEELFAQMEVDPKKMN